MHIGADMKIVPYNNCQYDPQMRGYNCAFGRHISKQLDQDYSVMLLVKVISYPSQSHFFSFF